MDLFNNDPGVNLLPEDGVVFYHGSVFSTDDSRSFFSELLKQIPWRHDEVVMFGKQIVTARKVAWVAEKGVAYAYSGKSRDPPTWTPLLLELKAKCESLTGSSYNSCLLNLYHDGGEGMGWHSDNERSIVTQSSIACLSFGAERKFSLKHKLSKDTVSIQLSDGSLLEMKGTTQENWLHQIPKSKKVTSPRISLTFREMAARD